MKITFNRPKRSGMNVFSRSHSHRRRRYSRHRKSKSVGLAVLFVVLALLVVSAFMGLSYYNSAQTLKNDATVLKTSLKESLSYLKAGDCDAADTSIAKVEASISVMESDLYDPKWDMLSAVPFAGKKITSDIETARRALIIADEATETILKPASAYIRELGLPDVNNIDLDNMGPEMGARINRYCDMIDEICPAGEKLMQDLEELPTFNFAFLEGKVIQYRSLPQQTDGMFTLLERTSTEILRPAAAVMSETPFSDLKAEDGIDVVVMMKYMNLFETIEPSVLELSEQLTSMSLINEDPARAEKVQTKLDSLLGLFDELNTYKPLVELIVGDSEDRMFMVVAQNCAEIRACGGFPGSIGKATVKDGILHFGDFQKVRAVLPSFETSSIEFSEVENTLYYELWYGRTSRNPDFTRAGEIYAATYEEYNPESVDGVISLTPHIIQRLLSITGPVTLSNGVTLDDTNAINYLQRQVYIDYFSTMSFEEANEITDALFAETADTVFKALMSNINKDSMLQFLSILSESGKDRVFMMWMKDAESEDELKRLGFAGELNTDPQNPAFGVFFTTTGGSRLGAYLDMQISYGEGINNADGTISYPVTVAVTNYVDDETLAIGLGNAYITSTWGGTIDSTIHLFGPAGGSVSDFANDGGIEISYEEYKDLQLGYALDFSLDPGVTITFTYYATTAPGVTTEPVIMTQPLIAEYCRVDAA